MATKKKPTKEKSEDPGVITTEQAARLLMCSHVWVGKLVKMGYIERVGRGRYNLVNVVQGYIRFLKDEDRRSSKSAAAARSKDVKTEFIEMQMKEKRRELVPMADAMEILDGSAAVVRSSIMSISSKYTRNKVERARLNEIIEATLNGIADQLDKKARALVTGKDLDA